MASRLSELLSKFFLVDFLKGMMLTGSHMFKEETTVEYPLVREGVKLRFRGALRLLRDAEHGEELCIGCQLCAKACPDDCIVVTMEKMTPGLLGFKTRHKTFEIDLSRCMWCDLCVEVCPTGAIVTTEDFELASYDKEDQKYAITALYGEIPKTKYLK